MASGGLRFPGLLLAGPGLRRWLVTVAIVTTAE